ncbi:MAG: efflux RND transporter periplasmic adaptor subunit [Desulfovibrionaceae bacterium]|nr:efflux RND transporter periplasmic adaptor subunit [Desulfovibrionaceae bacterium]MBF0514989.1 efflux RND transporter periplasmic adaptor subunit [Desulfovibrionaceae bacterium]
MRCCVLIFPLVLALILPAAAGVESATPGPGVVWVAAPGKIEPVSEEMRLGFDIPGKLADVLVEEGDAVAKGQVLAALDNADIVARVAQAEADLALKTAAYDKVVSGARDMERREARALLDEAEAVLVNAKSEYAHRAELLRRKAISVEEADRAEREYLVALKRATQARERFHLIDDPARREDVAAAAADLADARGKLDEARAYLEKSKIRSPIDGVVLRKHRRAGEMVSVNFDSPVVTVGDIASLRVRADVDEKDVDKVRLGQKAYMTADAYGARRFGGKVMRIAKILGRKNVRTDDPAEKSDTKILEVLIDLDGKEPLPVGLRMDVFIIVSEPGAGG